MALLVQIPFTFATGLGFLMYVIFRLQFHLNKSHLERAGAHIRGGLGGAKPPLASECHQKSVPFFLDTVRKFGPKIRVQELIFTSVSELGPITQELVGKML